MNPSMLLFAASEKTVSPSRLDTALAIVGPSEQASACSPRTHTSRTGSGAASARRGRPTTPSATAAAMHQANQAKWFEPRGTAGYGTTRSTRDPWRAARAEARSSHRDAQRGSGRHGEQGIPVSRHCHCKPLPSASAASAAAQVHPNRTLSRHPVQLPGEAQETESLAVEGQVAASADPSPSASSPASTQVSLGLSTVNGPEVGAMKLGQPHDGSFVCEVNVTSAE
jgi:hypothetical protein